ncbi:hypothetical protein [Bifidobacterium olomucense]|uniref:Aspartate/glutamate racemase family protein n=1 Tax=Bifidobacterium olomucense TaxID=2675324 RepID=A0A7Y0HVL4_9BIFI|nr:hypothetical protein [Bifidobacterium sp. DSM 109959]NMM98400.1 hypothetical protein [Bifidobacterium sp. DSM 109959]
MSASHSFSHLPQEAHNQTHHREHATIKRGRPFYGVSVGVAMLDSTIPHPLGDIGNATTFPFPVHYAIVQGIGPSDMIAPKSEKVREGFIDAVNTMAGQGIAVAGTSCGLMARYQSQIADRTAIPVATSSLLQVELALRLLRSDQKVLVVTIEQHGIDEEQLLESGVPQSDFARVRVAALTEATYLHGVITSDTDDYDVRRASDEVLAGIDQALASDDSIAAIVLECTNLAPFSEDIRHRTGLPVWDADTLIQWLHSAVQ